MAFIRPFKPEDTENAKEICRATLPPSLLASPAAIRMAPYLWTLPFTHLAPQHAFVLDDGAGNAVGYVIGAADVFRDLAAPYERYVAEVLRSEQGLADVPPPGQLEVKVTVGDEDWDGDKKFEGMAQEAYRAEWLILDGVEGKKELVGAYRAMLHINLAEGWRGKGWGAKMIERFVDSVKAAAEEGEGAVDYGKGVQLGVAAENTKVVPFYERCGFRVYPGGEKEGGNVWMVRDL